jgi:hypothetical protein
VVDLMEALRQSVGREVAPAKAAKPVKEPRKAAAGQKEMLMPIQGKSRRRRRRRRSPRRASGGSRLSRLMSGAPVVLQEKGKLPRSTAAAQRAIWWFDWTLR